LNVVNIVLNAGLPAFALVLATLGNYAVMAVTVVQRTAEIGLAWLQEPAAPGLSDAESEPRSGRTTWPHLSRIG
jgi:hypothetical protein